jgi:hypothetical protein
MTGTTPTAWLRAQRLRSQLLDGIEASALEVVSTLGAVQAQNALAGRWAIGVRAAGATDADIERLYADGAIVRSWTMRGTLHIVAAEDLGWMLSVTAARQRAAAAREAVVRGITEADFARASELIAQEVDESGPLTRAEALAALQRSGVDVGNERGYRFIRDAALRGVVAWGPSRGKQQQLVAVPAVGAAASETDRDEALARFLIRYVAGHSPVTVSDFAWWSGLTLTDARRALVVAGRRTESLGEEGWLVPAEGESLVQGSPSGETSAAGPVQATPAWDEYVLGYRERSPVLDLAFAGRVSPTGNGVFLPTIISSGRVVGTWRHSTQRSRLIVQTDPFTSLTASERRGFDASVDRMARFLGVSRA